MRENPLSLSALRGFVFGHRRFDAGVAEIIAGFHL
jgi:hypothetical protein